MENDPRIDGCDCGRDRTERRTTPDKVLALCSDHAAMHDKGVTFEVVRLRRKGRLNEGSNSRNENSSSPSEGQSG